MLSRKENKALFTKTHLVGSVIYEKPLSLLSVFNEGLSINLKHVYISHKAKQLKYVTCPQTTKVLQMQLSPQSKNPDLLKEIAKHPNSVERILLRVPFFATIIYSI